MGLLIFVYMYLFAMFCGDDRDFNNISINICGDYTSVLPDVTSRSSHLIMMLDC